MSRILKNISAPSIHILGAGSIGQLWALSLRSRDPSFPVTLLLRDCQGRRQKNVKTYWWKKGASSRDPPEKVSVPILPLSDPSIEADTLLVTTKSYQATDAVKSLLSTAAVKPRRLIILCNGALSVRDELQPFLNEIPLILSTTTHGAYRQNPSGGNDDDLPFDEPCLVHAGIGKVFLEDNAKNVVESWDAAGLNCRLLSEEKMNELLWQKLAANCVINPLTALFRCTNGELLIEPSFYELQQELLSEISQIAKAALPDTEGDVLDETMLRSFVQQVIQDTQQNRSSMLQDVLCGKQTEIDHLNEYVVKQGRVFGIETPSNEDLVARIREITSKNSI